MSGKKFRMPSGFDVDELFSTSFGPYIPEGSGRTIRFKAYGNEAKFLRDLPLHPSQKEVKSASSSEAVVFEIFAAPSKAMILEFCKHGSMVEVLSPVDVREAVKEELTKACSLY